MQDRKATLLVNRSERREDGTAVHVVIWRLKEPLPPCTHLFKYRLAYVADGACVLRYDDELGKGDHRHLGNRENPTFSARRKS